MLQVVPDSPDFKKAGCPLSLVHSKLPSVLHHTCTEQGVCESAYPMMGFAVVDVSDGLTANTPATANTTAINGRNDLKMFVFIVI
jgi:hypothetical protein